MLKLLFSVFCSVPNKKAFFLKQDQCTYDEISSGRSVSQTPLIFNVSDCNFFRSTVYNNHGGVIYFKDVEFDMKVSNSMFYNCIVEAPYSGGAIYCYSSTGQSVISMTCASSCTCSDWGHFVWSLTSTSKQNKLNYVSVTLCSPSQVGNGPIALDYGHQGATYLNDTNNKAETRSGFNVFEPSSFLMSYSSISFNKATTMICVRMYGKGGSVTSSNIVGNNMPSNGVISIGNNGQYSYTGCIFYDNFKTLFCVDSGNLEISSCYIYHNDIMTSGSVTALSIISQKANSFTLVFYSTYHCLVDSNVKTIIVLSSFSNKMLILSLFHYVLISI